MFEEVADGGSAAEGAQKIEAIGKRGKQISADKIKLRQETDPVRLEAAKEKHAAALDKAKKAQLEAIRRLEESGRLTPELIEAIENLSAAN